MVPVGRTTAPEAPTSVGATGIDGLVLADLALPKAALAVSLVSFNLGVEAGQLAIVGTFLPLAYLARRSWLYPRLVLGAGSLCIAAIASLWLIERSLNLSLFS